MSLDSWVRYLGIRYQDGLLSGMTNGPPPDETPNTDFGDESFVTGYYMGQNILAGPLHSCYNRPTRGLSSEVYEELCQGIGVVGEGDFR